MTINYYSNDTLIKPNWDMMCEGCGGVIVRGQKSERFWRKDDPFDLDGGHRRVEIRHLTCRPEGMPKVKRGPVRDARGRFSRVEYIGPRVGDLLNWERLTELPIGSQVTGAGNAVVYEMRPHGMMYGLRHSRRPDYRHAHVGESWVASRVGGSFTVNRIGPGDHPEPF